MAEDKRPVVTFLGPKASYTHQATLDVFNDTDYQLSPQITIEDVFSSIELGTAHRGVVPFENSTNGSVVFTLDLFADLNRKYPSILVCGESYIAVQHCLLGHPAPPKNSATSGQSTTPNHRGLQDLSSIIESPLSSGAVTPTTSDPLPQKPLALPLGDLSRIKKIYSHPQAWGQCKTFLNTYLKGVERQDVSSTSRAAELVARDKDGETAAVSSIIAAKIHGLDILAKGIEDRRDNTTRFFVIRKATPAEQELISKPKPKPKPTSTSTETAPTSTTKETATPAPAPAPEQQSPHKTLITFTIPHTSPGSLAQSLQVFSRYNLNLSRINTRPSGVENWNYIFFVEIVGRRNVDINDHGDRDGVKDKDKDERGDEDEGGVKDEDNVEEALRDLGAVCRGWRWIGSWENRLVS